MADHEGMDDMSASSPQASGTDPRQAAIEAAENALQPIAALLLELGISHHECARLVRRAYVDEAAARQRANSGRPTISRIAAATGMSRQEVSQVLAAAPKEQATTDLSLRPADRVLAAWTSDPEFLFDDGKPKPLRYTEGFPSFSDLVRKHGPDIPPRALLKELVASNLVSDIEDGSYIPGRPESAARAPRDEAIRDFGAKLNVLGATLLRNLQARDSKPLFEAMTFTGNLPAGLNARVARELERRCRTFSQAIERFLLDQASRGASDVTPEGRQELGVMVAVIEKPAALTKRFRNQEDHVEK